MRRGFAWFVLAFALLSWACTEKEGGPLEDRGAGPAELADRATACSPGIPQELCALFAHTGFVHEALGRINEAFRKRHQGLTEEAQRQAGELVAFVMARFRHGQVNPGCRPSPEACVSQVVRDILSEFFGVTIDPETAEAALQGGVIAVIPPEGGLAVAANRFGGASFPDDWSSIPRTFISIPLPDGSDPLNTEFVQVPKFFDDMIVPSAEDVPFNREVLVMVCAVTDALTPEQADALRLFHNVGDGGEVLDLVVDPALEARLNCENATDTSGPEEARSAGRGSGGIGLAGGKGGSANGLELAAGRGIGGQVSSFSPFGGVVALEAPGSPPVVTGVDFPSTIPNDPGSGFDNIGTVTFSDADGDVTHAFFEVVSGAATPFDFDPGVFGLTEGSFDFFFGCLADVPCTPGPITLAVVLEDAAGNLSEPFEFSFEVLETTPVPDAVRQGEGGLGRSSGGLR